MRVDIKSVQSTIATITLSKEEQDRLIIILRDYIKTNETVYTYRTVVDFAKRLGFALSPYMDVFNDGEEEKDNDEEQKIRDSARLAF